MPRPYARFPRYPIGDAHCRNVPARTEGAALRIYVLMPWTYDPAQPVRYPVVYICDGFWDFTLASGVYPHLLFDEAIPPCILVGLSYRDLGDVDRLRKLDLAPPETGDCCSPAGYLSTLRTQVFPFVERHYPADPHFRAIIGTSLGGLFALGSLFRAPGLFQAVVALSPIVGSYNRWLFAAERAYHEQQREVGRRLLGPKPALAASIFLAVGAEDRPHIVQDARAFSEQVQQRGYRGLRSTLLTLEGEKHGGVKPEGINRGLRFIFANR